MSELPEDSKHIEEDQPEFVALKEAIMLCSEPKEGFHIDGLFVMSVWHNNATGVKVADFLTNPPQETMNMLASIKAFAESVGL